MVDPLTFLLAALTLLATPGPTNTLLAMSGAATGFRASLHLLAAEVGGYMLSMLILGLVLGALLAAHPGAAIILKVACALYLVWLAVQLWRQGPAALLTAAPVTFRNVFATTLLNPKALIFTFVIVPYLKDGLLVAAAPYLAALAALIVCVGASWIALGSALRAGSGGNLAGGVVRRVGATALVLFAIVLGNSAWSAAAAMAGVSH